MSRMSATEIVLDKPRPFRLTPDDWREAARQYSRIMRFPVASMALLTMIGDGDDTATACALWAGCRADDPRLTIDKVLTELDSRRMREEGREDIGEALLSELRAIGVLRRQPGTEETPEGNPQEPKVSST